MFSYTCIQLCSYYMVIAVIMQPCGLTADFIATSFTHYLESLCLRAMMFTDMLRILHTNSLSWEAVWLVKFSPGHETCRLNYAQWMWKCCFLWTKNNVASGRCVLVYSVAIPSTQQSQRCNILPNAARYKL